MTDWGPLGEVLAQKASDRDLANVKELVGHARNLLKLVRETFPHYTMHDEQHAENVITLMGRLAAPRIKKMSGLEAALLILAAYFHDAGMAYRADEIAAIPDEEEFREFLDRHDEAFMATQQNQGVPPEAVVEQYCRARHADRVGVQLGRCDRKLLQWGNKSIIDQLELVCRSHNEPAAALHEPRFRTNFLYQADLRFCAIMLRLADILDLDDTRAPRVIYEHLGLSAHKSPEAAASDREWNKHLIARGFEFPPAPRPNYTLQFSAESEDPGDEHRLRAFLSVIEDELLQSRSAVDICDKRWRGLPLPASIDRAGIRSNGYRYGEFRFELDRSAVLELFTGEQLYDDPYAFVREVLQNALDATRARAHLYGYQSIGVQVWGWQDDGGYLWLRVDDDGIGMDEAALRLYLLRVGRSYYQSAAFRATIARSGRDDRPFGVISRFGIGVLSCFMAGDQVELSSRPVEGGKAVRLSINRHNDYFVLQEQGMTGRPFPGPAGSEPAFLRTPGTRIAVRIDPNHAGFDLDDLLAKVRAYLFAPPVPVAVNGEQVNRATEPFISEPIIDQPRVVDLAPSGQTAEAADPKLPPVPHDGVRIAAIPLNLTRDGGCPEVTGQLLLYTVLAPDGNRSERSFYSLQWPREFDPLTESTDHLTVVWYDGRQRRAASRVSLPALPGGARAVEIMGSGARWGYNGIALPPVTNEQDVLRTNGVSTVVLGYINLSEDLRPDLTVSRSRLKALPFPVHSALQLAVRRAFRKAVSDHPDIAGSYNFGSFRLTGLSPADPYIAATFRTDRQLRNGSWSAEELPMLGGASVEALRESFRQGEKRSIYLFPQDPRDLVIPGRYFPFYDAITAALLHFHVETECVAEEHRSRLVVTSDRTPQRPAGADHFAPMFSAPFRDNAALARANGIMNAGHPLTIWLLTNAETLSKHFPALFQRFFRIANFVDAEEFDAALKRAVSTGRVAAPPPTAHVRQDENGWWWSR